MSEHITGKEIKWYDRKLLLRSFVVGLMFFGLFWGLAKRAEPPEGYVFERLPAISGIYNCCYAGGRYSQSWVGAEGVNCLGFSYFHIGTGRNDCGLKEQLNGRHVTVERVLVPAYDGPLSIVSKIVSGETTYYEKSNQRMRELWIIGSRFDAAFGFNLAIIFHCFQLVYINRKFKKNPGEKA